MRAVSLIAEDGLVKVEFANMESNLCMHCHQSRGNPADDTDGTAIEEVPEHYGPHHGPQANVLNGLGGYEFGDDLSTSGAHESMASCVSCHMPSTATDTTGGHTWVAGIEGCTACHKDATDFDINGVQTEIQTLMASLSTALTTAGMMEGGHAVEDTSYQADSVGALWNYLLIEEDASHGIHNPDYAIDLLESSLEVFTTPSR